MTAEFMECTRQDAFFKGGRGYFPGHFFSLVYVAHLNFFFGGKCLVQDFFLTVKHRTWIAESSCSIFFSSIYVHIWIPLHDSLHAFLFLDMTDDTSWSGTTCCTSNLQSDSKKNLSSRSGTRPLIDYESPIPAPERKV